MNARQKAALNNLERMSHESKESTNRDLTFWTYAIAAIVFALLARRGDDA